jgi:hypothetical protein
LIRYFTLLTAFACLSGTGQATSTVTITNTFALGQMPLTGAPGPAAPLTPGSADGVHALGVSFSFAEGGNPSSSAIYGTSVGSDTLLGSPFSDPVLSGPGDGALTLNFDLPSTFLSFDIAFTFSEDSGGIVALGQSLSPFTTTGGAGLAGAFSVGHFFFAPVNPFTQAVIVFDGNVSQQLFAIDNLSYDAPTSDMAVPEPVQWPILSAGFFVIAALRGRKFRLFRNSL